MRENPIPEVALARALAQTIIRRRTELGLTQEFVANTARIDRSSLQNLEKAVSDRRTARPANPQLRTLIRIAQVLQMDTGDLIAEAVSSYEQAVSDNRGNSACS